MASVYKVTEIVGTSTRSWEDAARSAVKAAAKSLRELRVAEVSELDMTVENGKIKAYRAKVKLSFKYDATPAPAPAPEKKAPVVKAAKKKVAKKKAAKKRTTKKRATRKKASRKKKSRR